MKQEYKICCPDCMGDGCWNCEDRGFIYVDEPPKDNTCADCKRKNDCTEAGQCLNEAES